MSRKRFSPEEIVNKLRQGRPGVGLWQDGIGGVQADRDHRSDLLLLAEGIWRTEGRSRNSRALGQTVYCPANSDVSTSIFWDLSLSVLNGSSPFVDEATYNIARYQSQPGPGRIFRVGRMRIGAYSILTRIEHGVSLQG